MVNNNNNYLIIIFIIFIGFINLIKSFEFIIDYKSTIEYSNNECGGKVIKDDQIQYPPCKSIEEAGNRTREISKLNKDYDSSKLHIYIIRNDEAISDLYSFGTFDYYTEVIVTLVNKEMKSYPEVELEAQVINFNFTYSIKNLKTFLTLNQRFEELKPTSTYIVNGPFDFYGWDKKLNSQIIAVIGTREYTGDLIVNNVNFYQSYPFTNTYINPKVFKANNCIFNDTWCVPAYYKFSEFNNCQFNNFIGTDRLIETTSEFLKFNNCQFYNNSVDPLYNGMITQMTLSSIYNLEIKNSVFKDNFVKNIYLGGDQYFETSFYNLLFSNVSFSNTQLLDVFEDSITRVNYLFEVIYAEEGSVITFKDCNISAASEEDSGINGGLLHYFSNSQKGPLYANFENTYSNYNFTLDIFNITSDVILTFKNSIIRNWNDNIDSSSNSTSSSTSTSSSRSSSSHSGDNSSNKNLVLKIVLPIGLFLLVVIIALVIFIIKRKLKNSIKTNQIDLDSNLDNMTIKSAPSSAISSEKSAQVEI